MSTHKSDSEIVRTTHNTARFFTENRQIGIVLLLATMAWGIFGYFQMPQRKDPEIPIRVSAILCPWPGASAERIEQLITRRIEEKVAENARVEKIDSTTRTGVVFVFVTLDQDADVAKEFDDIGLKLDTINDLPQGAGPINFIKDFGDTAALMLTVASPRISQVDIELRARTIQRAIAGVRAGRPASGGTPVAIIYNFPQSISAEMVQRPMQAFAKFAAERGAIREPRVIDGAGFVGLDGLTDRGHAELNALAAEFIRHRLRASEFHPDGWGPLIIGDPATTEEQVASHAGSKYSYRELEDVSDLIKRTLQTVPLVSKITFSGVLDERVFLEYSQERLASYGIKTGALRQTLGARNITLAGGMLEVRDKNLTIDPSGEFRNEREIGDVLVPTQGGTPVYLRDLVQIGRAYDNPPRFLNFYTYRDASGAWQRARAITLAVQMRTGQQIADFDREVDAALEGLRAQLPDDIILARTSDQPLQVEENVDLFISSLYEAVALVVLVSLVGFWEWRSALLMALSIPITLAMTFGMMAMLGVDLQQISIASLIIALGLLVDDPVVAGDAIKRDLGMGHRPLVAAWLGPTKLATAILFATITNMVAYLPFLMLSGDTGRFLYTLPVVVCCSLVASRIVSMTFIPLLGYYLLRPKTEPSIEERRQRGFAAWYYRMGGAAIRHRWAVLTASLGVLALGGFFMAQLKPQYFPKDLQYLSWVDVWLPEDASFAATARAAGEVEDVVREIAEEFGKSHLPAGASTAGGGGQHVLESLTTFVGGGGPRFWLSATPEQSQLNYAQVLIQVTDKHLTNQLVGPLQAALDARIAGARVDVKLLEVGAPVGIPIAIRLSGDDIPTLRRLAGDVAGVLRSVDGAERVRDDWGIESFSVKLRIDADRANIAGLTNEDVAGSSVAGMNGLQVSVLREGDEQIPVVVRLRMEERAQLADVRNLYVYSSQGKQKVPLSQISTVEYGLQTEKLLRRRQFRTITVSAFPAEGMLSSEVLGAAMPRIAEIQAGLPPGYRLEIGGEYEEQVKGFLDLTKVMLISIAAIFLALVIQFRHAIKPLIVFAAIPYGMVGAFFALWVAGAPFGFMAFLGVASLIGVIVSHIIVLFDFIEERHAHGDTLEEALLGAGIMRLRPVLITVGATVIALFPLAAHGGPLWEPLCYAQIGGLTFATVITLLLVPVFYAIFVLDLRIVAWDTHAPEQIARPVPFEDVAGV